MRIRRQQPSRSTAVIAGTHPVAVASLLFSFAVAGCAGVSSSSAPDPASPPQTASQPAPQPPLHANTPTPTAAPPEAQETPGEGTIRRAELDQVLNQGAQTFISLLRVRPAFRNGTFWGWRILAYNGPGPIQVGDIVHRINEKRIEKPQQVMKVWENIGLSPTLTVELHRSGKLLTLKYTIE